MRKGPKSIAVLAVMVITVFALYYYLVNKVERFSPEVETTPVQDVLLRNLETDYPATVREVIKYYNEIMSDFANRFKELRVESGLSQRQVAKVFGVSQTSIERWESGATKTDIDTLIRICKYFGASADYLLGLENEDGTRNY